MKQRFTPTQSTISSFNRIQAWKHFWPEGNGKAKEGYCLHHKDPSWLTNDIDRYISWNIEDLVMITRAEHNAIHTLGKHWKMSEETKQKFKKIRNTPEWKAKLKNANIGENNPMFGKHWWTNGVEDKISDKCPAEGWYRGKSNMPKLSDGTSCKDYMTTEEIESWKHKLSKVCAGQLWWNNGSTSIRAKERPSEEWKKGRLKGSMEWWTNGVINKRSSTCPEGFVKGRTRKS